jgi:hypothetical protein
LKKTTSHISSKLQHFALLALLEGYIGMLNFHSIFSFLTEWPETSFAINPTYRSKAEIKN